MKEFIQTIKQLYQVNRKSMCKYVLYALLGSAGGIGSMLCFLAWDDTAHYYAQMGTLTSLVLSLMVYFFVGGIEVTEEFNLAISMGKTRKYFVPAKYILQVGNVAVLVIIALVTGLVEDALYPFLYSGLEDKTSFVRIILDPRVLLAIVFLYTVLVLVIGALGLRFSYGKVYFALAGLLMLLSMLFARIAEMAEQGDYVLPALIIGILNFCLNSSVMQIAAIELVLTAAGLLGVLALLRRQQVTILKVL